MLKFQRSKCTCGADLSKRKVKLEDTHSQLRVPEDPASGEFTLAFADCPKCGHPWPVLDAEAQAKAEAKAEAESESEPEPEPEPEPKPEPEPEPEPVAEPETPPAED